MALNVVWLNGVIFVSNYVDGKGGIATLILHVMASIMMFWGTKLIQQWL
jgi:hypothetical protein